MAEDDASGKEKLRLLAKCPVKKVSSFVHRTIDIICGRAGPSYNNYSEIFNLEEWWSVQDECRKFCEECGRQRLSKEEIVSQLQYLPDEVSRVITEAVGLRQEDLRAGLVTQTTAISSAFLKDFDWRLKLCLSSDKISSVHQPLLSVDFDLQTQTGNKIVSLELNKDDLQKLIASLEAANSACMQLKS